MTEESPFEKTLFNEEIISSIHDNNTLLKQYEIYVDLMDKIYERRSKVNTFFLSLNSILLTGLAAFLSQAGNAQINYMWLLVAVAGIAFCVTWRQAIFSSRALIVAKYKIIHLLESKLPVRLFDAEWDALKQSKHQYTPFSNIERSIPLVFMSAYVVIAVLSVIQSF